MFIIIILALILGLLLVFVTGMISVIGASAIVVFGDIIIAVVFIVWLIKKLIDR
jgi:hypothetical protein